MQIKKQRIIRIGSSFYIGIPSRYVSDGYINPEELYDMVLEKSNGKENDKSDQS